jgi:RNA polymerase sigma factor (sigma-70 family)
MPATVTEIATKAKTDPALMPELWQTVQRLVGWYAPRYMANGAKQGSRLYDCDDLTQVGYLALVNAVKGFDTNAGASFLAYLRYHIRQQFAECAGRRGSKRRPELYAESLNAPLNDESEICRLDMMVDPEAHYAYEDIIEVVDDHQAYTAIVAEMEKLPQQLRQAIDISICQGATLKDTAAVMGVSSERVRQCRESGLRRLRNSKAARIIELDFQHVTLASYKRNFTSAVEREVLQRERRGYY